MIEISAKSKELLSKYVGPDGRFIIDDSLPDDIKESFSFFNEEGINPLQMSGDGIVSVNNEIGETLGEVESFGEQMMETEARSGLDTNEANVTIPNSNVKKEIAEKDLEDLDSLF